MSNANVYANTSTNGQNSKNGRRMILISVHIPRQLLEEMDRLVQDGYFPNRSELIRQAITYLLEKYRLRQLAHQTPQNTHIITIIPGR